MADNIHSILCIADGLKPGQREIIWGCFKHKRKKEIRVCHVNCEGAALFDMLTKVAKLVGYIGEQAVYHHGEVSLAQMIINLAQNFVGSNNLSLLKLAGQYGTHEQGGKNHASLSLNLCQSPRLFSTL